MSSPLGALPRLSSSARKALWLTGILGVGNAVALVLQAWALSSALAAVVGSRVSPEALSWQFLTLAAAIALKAVCGWGSEATAARAAVGAKEELRSALLDAALRNGPEWITNVGAARVSTVATKGLDALDAYFVRYLPALIAAGVIPPFVGAWILVTDPTSAILIVITVPLIPLFAWLVGLYTQRRVRRAADATARLSGYMLELVRALPVLTAFGRAAAQREAVRNVSESHRRATGSTLRVAFLSALVLELLSSLSVALVAVGIGFRLVDGELGLASGLFVLILVGECYLPLRAAGAAHHASEDGLEAVRRVAEITDSAEPSRDGGESSGRVVPRGELRVEELRVPRGDRYIPDGLSFTAGEGEIVRLDRLEGHVDLGPSGSGKTTVFSALLGFTSRSGSITLGRVEQSDVDIDQWRRVIAWMPQRPSFSGDTVRAELELAIADQSGLAASEDELRDVLTRARAAHLIEREVDGLSTGERQRIAFARALLRVARGARLVLLDEPVAHLDPATASHVMSEIRALHGRAPGVIVVFASHRGDEASPPVDDTARVSTDDTPEAAEAPRPVRELITPRLLFGGFLGAASLICGVALMATAAWLIARASQQPPVLALSVAAVGVRTFALSRAVLRYCERLVSHDGAFRLAGRMRERLWDALVRLGPALATAFRRSEGLSRLVDDVDTVRDLVPRVLLPPIIAVFVGLAAVTTQFLVLPAAGVLLGVCLVAAAVIAPACALIVDARASVAVSAGRRRVAAGVFALLDAAAEQLAFGVHRLRRADLAAEDAELAKRARRVATAQGLADAVITVCVGVAVFGAAWLAAAATARGDLDPVLAVVVTLLPLATAEAFAALPSAAQQWRSLRAAQARVAAVDGDRAATAVDDDRADSEPTRADAGVQLRGVEVRWPSASAPVLDEVNLSVPAGSWVAVMGPSGSGKTTLMALLLGFLKPQRGSIVTPPRLSWCPQEPQLVSTTIAENLRLGDPRATDERLREALRIAELAEFTDRLDVVVGSDGASLSGGQAARVALARALVPDADLVLLDEPTAHLDAATADAVLRHVRHRLRGRTVIHVTHRAAEAELADMVVRVDGSRCVVSGNQRATASVR